MAGINLSQPTEAQEEEQTAIKKQSFLNLGLSLSLGLFLVVFAGWGILRYFTISLDKKLASVDEIIANNTAKLRGPQVDRIVNFNDRINFLSKSLNANTDPKNHLQLIESLMVSSVSLVGYEYNAIDRVAKVSVTTDSFRAIAEQIISLQSEKTVSRVQAGTAKHNTAGKLAFDLIVHF